MCGLQMMSCISYDRNHSKVRIEPHSSRSQGPLVLDTSSTSSHASQHRSPDRTNDSLLTTASTQTPPATAEREATTRSYMLASLIAILVMKENG